MDVHARHEAWSFKKPYASNLGKSKYFSRLEILWNLHSFYKARKKQAHRGEVELPLDAQASFARGSTFRSVAHPGHLGTPASGFGVSGRRRLKIIRLSQREPSLLSA